MAHDLPDSKLDCEVMAHDLSHPHVDCGPTHSLPNLSLIELADLAKMQILTVVTLSVYTASASIKEIFSMRFEPSSATCWRRKSAKRTASSGEQDNGRDGKGGERQGS